jgi:hypothetical protein
MIAPSEKVQEVLNKVQFIVEATSDENFFLWKENVHHEKCKYVKSWEQENLGYWAKIGEVDARPIIISMNFATIGGIYVMFVEQTSQLCDYKMMEEWLKEHCPAYSDRRNNTTNAMNFHILTHKIS